MKLGKFALFVVYGLSAASAIAEESCYDVRLSPWKPALRLGGDEIFSTPPSKIALTHDVARVVNGNKEFSIVPALGEKPSVHKFAYWYAEGEKIHLVWSNGLSGLHMELSPTKTGYHGIANTFWDFDRRPQSSDVTLVEIACH